MKHLAVFLFALSLSSAAQGQALPQPDDLRQYVAQWQYDFAVCRGTVEGPDQEYSCDQSKLLASNFQEIGLCYDTSELEWLCCGSEACTSRYGTEFIQAAPNLTTDRQPQAKPE